jgi:hypothetical protein
MEEHDRLADQHLEDADRIQEVSDNLEGDIKDTREDWEQKKQTESAPGVIKTEAELEAEAEAEKPDPNEFEFEERSPETAEAQGPSAIDDTGDDDDEDDSEDGS